MLSYLDAVIGDQILGSGPNRPLFYSLQISANQSQKLNHRAGALPRKKFCFNYNAGDGTGLINWLTHGFRRIICVRTDALIKKQRPGLCSDAATRLPGPCFPSLWAQNIGTQEGARACICPSRCGAGTGANQRVARGASAGSGGPRSSFAHQSDAWTQEIEWHRIGWSACSRLQPYERTPGTRHLARGGKP